MQYIKLKKSTITRTPKMGIAKKKMNEPEGGGG